MPTGGGSRGHYFFARGHYFFAVQGNQPTRQQDITAIWDGEPAAAAQGLQTNQHGGRVEQRRLWVSDLVVGYSDWPHRAQVCKMERIVRKKNATRREVAYAVTSLPPEAAGPDRPSPFGGDTGASRTECIGTGRYL